MATPINISALNAAIDYCDLWLHRQMRLNDELPGATIAIMHDGHLLYNKSFGHANHDTKEVLTPDHLFLAASHTKSFTAVSILQLVDSGRLSLDDKLTDLIPQLKSNPDPKMHDITLEHLLTHSSGLSRDGDDATFFSCLRPFPTKDDILSFFEKNPVITKPGKLFKYSNFAYALLGFILEDISGLTFNKYIYKHIIDPLDLLRICPQYDEQKSPYSSGHNKYTPDTKNILPIDSFIDTKGMFAAASVCSNAESLCRFYTALMVGSGALLSDHMKEKMLSKHYDVNLTPDHLGYGYGIVHDKMDGRYLNGHGGGMPGHITRTYIDPQSRITICIMANSYACDMKLLQNGLWHIVDHFQCHYNAKTEFSNYCGEFYNHWGSHYFMPLGDTIFCTNLNVAKPFDDAPEITKDHNDMFIVTKDSGYSSLYEQVTFSFSKNGLKEISYGPAKLFRKNDYIKLLK